jgi:hypothetical protein
VVSVGNKFVRLTYLPILKIYSFVNQRINLYLLFSTMPNPKGNPQNFEPIKSDREKPLEGRLTIRVTKEMEEEVKAQDNPPEFCREAIQEKLDKQKNT